MGLQNSLQTIKNQIREQARVRIKDALELEESVFNELPKEKLKEIIIQLETEVQQKFPQVDSTYNKRINDTCENIKYLRKYKEIAEKIAQNKGI